MEKIYRVEIFASDYDKDVENYFPLSDFFVDEDKAKKAAEEINKLNLDELNEQLRPVGGYLVRNSFGINKACVFSYNIDATVEKDYKATNEELTAKYVTLYNETVAAVGELYDKIVASAGMRSVKGLEAYLAYINQAAGLDLLTEVFKHEGVIYLGLESHDVAFQSLTLDDMLKVHHILCRILYDE